jgi:hypothetical protein
MLVLRRDVHLIRRLARSASKRIVREIAHKTGAAIPTIPQEI